MTTISTARGRMPAPSTDTWPWHPSTPMVRRQARRRAPVPWWGAVPMVLLAGACWAIALFAVAPLGVEPDPGGGHEMPGSLASPQGAEASLAASTSADATDTARRWIAAERRRDDATLRALLHPSFSAPTDRGRVRIPAWRSLRRAQWEGREDYSAEIRGIRPCAAADRAKACAEEIELDERWRVHDGAGRRLVRGRARLTIADRLIIEEVHWEISVSPHS